MLEWTTIECPYCAEPFETAVDCSAGDQTYVEDCQICCQPILIGINVSAEFELLAVTSRQENE